MTNPVEIAKALISRPSITPNDAGCQEFIADLLKKVVFLAIFYPKARLATFG